MGAEQSVSASRRNQLAVSAVFLGPRGRFHFVEDARRGNHDLTTAGHPGNVGSNQAQEAAHKASHQRVILIDGEQLTRLLVRYSVGVRKARTIDLGQIDENYFQSGE
jgi:restriction endonuclease Mrr